VASHDLAERPLKERHVQVSAQLDGALKLVRKIGRA